MKLPRATLRRGARRLRRARRPAGGHEPASARAWLAAAAGAIAIAALGPLLILRVHRYDPPAPLAPTDCSAVARHVAELLEPAILAAEHPPHDETRAGVTHEARDRARDAFRDELRAACERGEITDAAAACALQSPAARVLSCGDSLEQAVARGWARGRAAAR